MYLRKKNISPIYSPLEITYADYAAWQRRWFSETDILDRQLEYWRNALDGAPELLTLPTDYPRLSDRSRLSNYLSIKIQPSIAKRLETQAQLHGTTIFAVLIGAYAYILGRLARQDDIVVGVPVAGRNNSQIENIIGFFVNTLAIRLELAEIVTGDDLINLAKTVTLDALSNQEVPFERLVEDLTNV